MSKKPTPKAKSKPISKESPDDVVTNDQDENDAQSAELSLDEQLELMQEKADVNWDKYLRAVAELENVRKRASRDVENAR